MQQVIQARQLDSVRWRIISGVLLAVVGILIILIMPYVFSWKWLGDHPNRLGLYGCGVLIWLGVSWSVADTKHRNWSLGAVALGSFLVLLQILGR